MTQIQAARPVEIITPLGDDVLLFQRMTATEQLGRLFEFELDLLSKEPDIKFEDILLDLLPSYRCNNWVTPIRDTLLKPAPSLEGGPCNH